MAAYKHFLLTRFNARFDGKAGARPNWLRHRLAIFESFCLPSVRGQSVTDFNWLLFCDPDTPAEFRSRIEAVGGDARFHPCFVREFEEIPAEVRLRTPAECTHIITSSLDNDDAIGVRFMENVRAEFHGQDFEILNFPSGYRLALASGKLYRRRIPGPNPFVSLIERNGASLKTIRGCGPHSRLVDFRAAVRNVETAPLWLQVIHDRNKVGTGVWGWRRVPAGEIAGSFTLAWTPPRTSERRLNIKAENIRRRAERFLMSFLAPGRRRALRGFLRRRRRR